jgi:hypothetical protein
MLCTVTVRRLKPGSYDAFREAVQPQFWPAGLTKISVLRNQEDPDEVCTIGYLDMSPDALDMLRDSPELLTAEAGRVERVAAFVETVVVNGIFELSDDLHPST